MAFSGDDAQASQGLDLLVVHLPLLEQRGHLGGALRLGQGFVGFDGCHILLDVAAQHDVGTTAGHVGGDGDHALTTRLGHDVGLTGVLLGIEHLVGQAFLVQKLVDDFGVLDRGRAHQHGLAALVAFADVLDRSFVLLTRGLVHAVQLVVALAGPVGRNDHGFQAIDFLELIGFGVGCARHASEFAVQAEIVLEGDGGQRLVLGLDVHPFLGFHGLVQAFAPAAARHQAAGELVHDDDLAVLHHVVLIAVVQVVGPQRRIQVVHQRDVGRVVHRRAFGDQAVGRQNAFGRLVALLGQEHLVGFFVQREVAGLGHALTRAGVGFALLAHQQGHHLVHGDVHRRVVFGLATDDERRAGFVDQDRVHLVHDGKVQALLHAVLRFVDHVVAQVVKAVFVVGAVGDVGPVRRLLFFAGHVGQVDAHREAQEVVKAPHPLRVAVGEVVIHRHHVHALARESIEVHRQRGRQGLAFAGAHFGDLAEVQRHAAQQLHIKVPHLHDALGALAHHGKRFGKDAVQRLAFGHAVLELLRLGPELLVRQLLVLGLHRIDAVHRLAVLLEKPVIAAAEYFGEEVGGHANRTACPAAISASGDRNP